MFLEGYWLRLTHSVPHLLDQVAQATSTVPEVTGLIVRVNYRKTRSVLDDDVDGFVSNRTWRTTIGNTQYTHIFIYAQ